MATRKEIADALKEAAAFMFFRYRYSITFELGLTSWGGRRADVIGCKISGDLVMIEVKSSVADFRVDTKWQEYLPFCDRFYLIFTEDVARRINKNPELMARIPKRVGVLVLSSKTGYARTVKPARRVAVAPDIRITTLARLAWRAGDLSKRTNRQRKRIYIDS
jgi:hypothetical protein